jgi:hypothetical protein
MNRLIIFVVLILIFFSFGLPGCSKGQKQATTEELSTGTTDTSVTSPKFFESQMFKIVSED